MFINKAHMLRVVYNIINNPQHMRFINKHLYHQACDAYLITTSLCNHSHNERSKKLNNANIRHLKMSKQGVLVLTFLNALCSHYLVFLIVRYDYDYIMR